MVRNTKKERRRVKMAKLAYWKIFQILVGAWLFVSPFVFGHSAEMTTMTMNSMIFGAVVALLGLGMAFFHKEVCAGVEQAIKKTA
jgi:protein-S-isoprenylcysteine O-methyltransferase Ste14